MRGLCDLFYEFRALLSLRARGVEGLRASLCTGGAARYMFDVYGEVGVGRVKFLLKSAVTGAGNSWVRISSLA